MTFKTMADVRAANKAAGECWFDRKTIKFWGSRIEGGLHAGRYFISSEFNFQRKRRLYTIRQVMPDDSIETVGEFQAYRFLEDARDALRGMKRNSKEAE